MKNRDGLASRAPMPTPYSYLQEKVGLSVKAREVHGPRKRLFVRAVKWVNHLYQFHQLLRRLF